MGAAFLANTDIDHVLAILRDYDLYKDYYRPSVVQSKSIARNGGEDKAWMVFLNKSFFMKTRWTWMTTSLMLVSTKTAAIEFQLHRGSKKSSDTANRARPFCRKARERASHGSYTLSRVSSSAITEST